MGENENHVQGSIADERSPKLDGVTNYVMRVA